MSMHLDPGKHAALLAGTLGPEEARALAAHLAAGCDRCEGFLASRTAADALDGRVDRALVAVGGERATRTRPALGAAVAPVADLRSIAGQRRPARPWAIPALAAAALVLVASAAALVAHGPERPAWDGVKGAAPTAIPVRLRFLVVEGEDAAALRRGAAGETVRAGARLEFEVELGAPANVALVRIGPDGAAEAFWEGALGPGASIVTLDGGPAAYALEGLAGAQRFVAVAAGAPLAGGAAADAARAVSAGRAPPAGVAADAVEVRVE